MVYSFKVREIYNFKYKIVNCNCCKFEEKIVEIGIDLWYNGKRC